MIYRTQSWVRELIRRGRCSAVAVVFALSPAVAPAVQPSDGFFFGIEMDPVGDASVTALETEPAVALIFAADQKTADITRQFNEWFNSPHRPAVEVYAIAVEPGDISREVLVEAINQRDLQMPVFLARSDMLLGDDFRLVVLNNDQEVQRFTTLDVAGVYAALSGLGIEVPETPAPAPPIASPAPPAAPPDPGPPIIPPPALTPVPMDPSVDEGTAATNPVILGGPGGDQFYLNRVYGMSIKFPPDWRYQIAAQRDGAVAFEPEGSKMDMRLWAMPAGGMESPQEYVDHTLEALAEKNGTRVNVERKFQVTEDGVAGLDVTYNYTRLLDAAVPARGGLLYRGRMQVFLDDGTIKAARVAAPSGEFGAFFPIIDAYILSFQSTPREIPPPPGNSSPNNI